MVIGCVAERKSLHLHLSFSAKFTNCLPTENCKGFFASLMQLFYKVRLRKEYTFSKPHVWQVHPTAESYFFKLSLCERG